MNNIEVYCPNVGVGLNYKSFIFPGGEVGVKFTSERPRPLNTRHRIVILLRAKSPEDLIELAMVKDAVERTYDPLTVDLVIPYLPYARQDRVCDSGEAFSLKVFANYLNFLNFNKVTIYDPHSDVAPALIDRVEVISQEEIIRKSPEIVAKLTHGITLVSPDAGANKKVAKLAKALGLNSFIRCDKLRDLSTGKIIETKIYADEQDIQGGQFLIVDDICDGGATFIELVKVLKAKGAKRVELYITHGIFSKGIKHLTDNGVDWIWTTNSLFKNSEKFDAETQSNVTVLEVL